MSGTSSQAASYQKPKTATAAGGSGSSASSAASRPQQGVLRGNNRTSTPSTPVSTLASALEAEDDVEEDHDGDVEEDHDGDEPNGSSGSGSAQPGGRGERRRRTQLRQRALPSVGWRLVGGRHSRR